MHILMEHSAASFGGLIGLCTGFSFLSAAELAYFFTLRCTLPLCRRRRSRRLNDKLQAMKSMIGNGEDLVVVKMDE